MNKFIDQLSEQISHPISFFFFVAYVLSLFMFHMKARRKILATKFISDCNYATYYYFMDGLSGAIGALIAALGGFIQACTPDKYMTRSKYYRLSFAIILSAIGMHFATARSSDMLPLAAIILGRLAEMSPTPQKVRIRMAITFPAWIVYNFMNGFYLLLFANVTALISLFWAIWKHHSIKHRTEPV